MAPIDQQLRDYYSSQRLGADSAAEILARGRAAAAAHRRSWVPFSAAAAVLVAAAGLLLIAPAPADPSSDVAHEVAYNHSKRSQPAVGAGGFEEVRAGLPRIRFSLRPEDPDTLAGCQVLGGSYCSLQSELAAQLKLALPGGDYADSTLYICKAEGKLAAVAPGTHSVGDVRVDLWHDGGRLYALARDESVAPSEGGKKGKPPPAAPPPGPRGDPPAPGTPDE